MRLNGRSNAERWCTVGSDRFSYMGADWATEGNAQLAGRLQKGENFVKCIAVLRIQ